MKTSLLSRSTGVRVPAHWPAAVHPQILAQVDHPTPYLMCDLETVRDRLRRLRTSLPGVRFFYAMKCNSAEPVLEALAGLAANFEVASLGELLMLQKVGVDLSEVLYSNTVKPPSHIAEAYRLGLWRFAFDSEGELYKLGALTTLYCLLVFLVIGTPWLMFITR